MRFDIYALYLFLKEIQLLMKKFFIALMICIASICGFSSCDTITFAASTPYGYDDYRDNIVIRDNVCYIYCENPSISLLSTLRIIDGYYYYPYYNRNIRVEFPMWYSWSPYRHFYYDGGRVMWRDRVRYNHDAFRRNYKYIDYRQYPIPRYPKYNNPIDIMHRRNVGKPQNPQNRIGGSFGNMRKIPNDNHFGGRR